MLIQFHASVNMMKNSGKCPKCGSTDIDGPLKKMGAGFNLSAFRGVRLVGYVCVSCGFVEDHVDRRGMKHIRHHFEKRTHCPDCGNDVRRLSKKCQKCGSVLVPSPLASDSQLQRECPKCGALQSYETSLCFECGESLTD